MSLMPSCGGDAATLSELQAGEFLFHLSGQLQNLDSSAVVCLELCSPFAACGTRGSGDKVVVATVRE